MGATTVAEYRKESEKDKALERSCEKVNRKEPEIEKAISKRRGLKDRYEIYNGLRSEDKA